jgi:hypothetical protein
MHAIQQLLIQESRILDKYWKNIYLTCSTHNSSQKAESFCSIVHSSYELYECDSLRCLVDAKATKAYWKFEMLQLTPFSPTRLSFSAYLQVLLYLATWIQRWVILWQYSYYMQNTPRKLIQIF